MKRIHLLLTTTALLLGFGSLGIALSDDDGDERGKGREERKERSLIQANIAPATDPAYLKECGSCHLSYPPGLLTEGAWRRIISPESLSAHYGDDASLPEQTRAAIESYLIANAADQSRRSRERAFAAFANPDEAGGDLPRITQAAYFIRKHDEIPPRLVADNPEVKSFSQCDRCHADANKGDFDEDRVNIPGYGPWEKD
ncbi:cytochrome C [Caldichromatium japonicum]|uniref:Cytochrome C n=1 Tax=Caldichromatium japonicum TaxID=2699430 RepID=A0A6G7V9Y1_9GAMM|nr:cytochrome C [Caldichromatium japonicum]QIK36658.1 cytochrome C [Caldichromatium japonicum]